MESPTRAISLTERHPESGVQPGVALESEPPPTAAHALPPISRKKQTAVLLSAFVTIALTIGYNQTFGVFQAYYLSAEQDMLVPAPASQASPPTALLATG